MNEADLKAIRERAEKATVGPWDEVGGSVVAGEFGDGEVIFPPAEIDSLDALFTAHAREDVPALIAEVERLRAALEAAKIPHRDCCCYMACDKSGGREDPGAVCRENACGADAHNAAIIKALGA